MSAQGDLFAAGAGAAPPAVPGLLYQADFLTPAEEGDLLGIVAGLPLAAARYKAYTALRRTASYGGEYDFEAHRLRPGLPLPAALRPLRERAAGLIGVPGDALVHTLVAEYPPGAPLGWHRDVPDFEDVVGISLGAAARMRLRRYPPLHPRRADVLNVVIEPRSAYALRGAARWEWQHSLAAAEAPRWSITFRTRRAR